MNHLSRCRTQLVELFPNYGSDCTCGLEYLIGLVNQEWHGGPEAVAEFLNNTIAWQLNPEAKLKYMEESL